MRFGILQLTRCTVQRKYVYIYPAASRAGVGASEQEEGGVTVLSSGLFDERLDIRHATGG